MHRPVTLVHKCSWKFWSCRHLHLPLACMHGLARMLFVTMSYVASKDEVQAKWLQYSI